LSYQESWLMPFHQACARGFDPDTGNKVTVAIRSSITGRVTVPFIPAIARFIFVGNIVEVVIDDSDHARDLRR